MTMKMILSKAKVHPLLLTLLYATTQSTCASQLRPRELVAFDEDCTALIVERAPEDTQSLVCETQSGLMYEIPQADKRFITNNFVNGPFVSGETDMTFPGGAKMNKNKNTISNSMKDFVLSKKKKKNIPKRKLATVTGDKTVLVVRVVANDGSTTSNEATLSDGVFGTFGDPVNLKSQYATCSRDQLNIIPADPRTGVNGVEIVDGVTTMTVNVNTTQTDSIMRPAITNALNAEFGVSRPDQLADHVMYCLPPSTMGGIAYAYINSWNSVYSDQWCGYVSVQLHEIGHNLNLAHANENGEYRDQSGMMGYSYSQSNTPEMCFNAAKSWQLGWYENRHLQVNIDSAAPGSVLYNGDIAYFNDGNLSDLGPPMIIKLNTASSTDFYMFFNHKDGFNQGTLEGGDQVMITQQGNEGSGYSPSELLVKLSAGGTWTESSSSTVVEVISIGSRATVKICKDFCSTTAPTVSPTTKAPTASPTTTAPTTSPTTKAPTASPTTKAPTTSPTTKAPTASPTTKAPTASPTTKAPTASPTTKAPTTSSPITKAPTVSPITKAPTASPTTKDPTASPTTKAPTTSPTKAPTASPTKSPTASPTTKTPTATPTTSPTASPTSSPTKAPTAPPTKPPTASPTKAPTTSPTKAPTIPPTKAPTTSPTTETPTASPTTKAPTACEDSPLQFKVKLPNDKNNKVVFKGCSWVGKDSNLHCAIEGVSSTCPLTCGLCSECKDSPLLIKVAQGNKKFSCKWIAGKKQSSRCNAFVGAKETCRSTCQLCTP